MHHGGAQDFIYAGLISLSLGFEPRKNVGINPESEWLFDGAIEFSHYGSSPIAHFRNVGQVNVLLFHFRQVPDFLCLFSIYFVHMAFFHATLLFERK
jgi:hypothetical protein